MMQKIIEVRDLVMQYGEHTIHSHIGFHVLKHDIFAILGGSGSGKSTLLEAMILLKKPSRGEICIFGKDIWSMDERERLALKLNCGVLFQFGALFSSLTILENICIGLLEYGHFSKKIAQEMAKMWLSRVGLGMEVCKLYPSELSGGMIKRAALARALAMNPEILFLDEPTSGLDPKSARQFDRLICELQEVLGMSVVMVTHDMQSVREIVSRLVVLKDGKVFFEGSLDALSQKVGPIDHF